MPGQQFDIFLSYNSAGRSANALKRVILILLIILLLADEGKGVFSQTGERPAPSCPQTPAVKDSLAEMGMLLSEAAWHRKAVKIEDAKYARPDSYMAQLLKQHILTYRFDDSALDDLGLRRLYGRLAAQGQSKSRSESQGTLQKRDNYANAEASIRGVVAQFFDAYKRKDLPGLMALISAQSPDRVTLKQEAEKSFAKAMGKGYVDISIAVSRVIVNGDQATARVVLKTQPCDQSTKLRLPFRTVQNFYFIKEPSRWVISQSNDAGVDLSNKLRKLGEWYSVDQKYQVSLKSEAAILLSEDHEAAIDLVDLLIKTGNDMPIIKTGNDIPQNHTLARFLCYSTALQVATQIGHQERILKVMLNLGNLFYMDGYLEQAKSFYESIYKLIQEQKGPEQREPGMKTQEILALIALGNVAKKQGNELEAEKYFYEGWEILKDPKICVSDPYWHPNFLRGLLHNNRGLTLYALGETKDGEKTLNAAKGFYENAGLDKTSGEYKRAIAMVQFNKSSHIFLLDPKRADEALPGLKDCLKTFDELPDTKLEAVLCRSVLSSVYLAKGNREEAFEYAKNGLKLAVSIGNAEGVRQAHVSLGLFYHESIRGEEALKSGKVDDVLKSSGWENALKEYNSAIEITEKMRDALSSNTTDTLIAQTFLSDKILPYHLKTDLLITQGRIYEKSDPLMAQSKFHEAFKCAENAKSRTLLEMLEKRELNDKAPEYSLPHDMDSLLPDDQTALLEYVVTGDRTFLFVVTKGKNSGKAVISNVITINISKLQLRYQVLDLKGMLRTNNISIDEINPKARNLYRLLFGDAGTALPWKRLIIIPDGPLWQLPFQVLRDSNKEYLIQKHAISYAPSVSFLNEVTRRRNKRPWPIKSPTLLAIGNPTFSHIGKYGEPLPDLPEFAELAQELARLYNGNPSLPPPCIKGCATEDWIRGNVGKHDVLFLGTHGVFTSSAMDSYLSAAQDKKSVTDDGYWQAWEISRLDLSRIEVAVLAACSSAEGNSVDGEGMLGLSWSFLAAGCTTVVASQWKVEPGPTSTLMIDFHRQLRSTLTGYTISGEKINMTRAEALQKGILNQLNANGKQRHPYYWAPFILIGDWRQSPY